MGPDDLLPTFPKPGVRLDLRRIAILFAAAFALTGAAWISWHKDAPDPEEIAARRRAELSADVVPPGLAKAKRPPKSRPAAGSSTAEQRWDRDHPWRLTGAVRDADGSPVVGARVRVVIERGETREDAGVAQSKAPDGTYAIDLASVEAMPEILRAAGHLKVSASAPHCRPSEEVELRLPGVGRVARLQADLVLVPGGTLRGRVLGPGGVPAREANVTLESVSTEFVVSGSTAADGRYELGIEETAPFRLRAVAEGLGACAAGPLPLEKGADSEAPDLLLRGPGSISGAVRYKDGAPVADVGVWARPDDGRGTSGPSYEADPVDWNLGLVRAHATSAADGRFTLGGLKPGRYVVWAGGASDDDTRNTFSTGEQDAVLVMMQHRLRVKIRDAEGRPVPDASYSAKWEDAAGEAFSVGNVTASDATIDFWGRAGTRYLLAAHVEGIDLTEAVVTLEPGVNEVGATLALTPPTGEVGAVRLSVVGPAGEPVPEFEATFKTDLTHAWVTPRVDKVSEGAGRRFSLPPGRYQVTVHPGRKQEDAALETYFPIEVSIDARAGAETPVVLKARLGGRVKVTVCAAPGNLLVQTGIEVSVQPHAGGAAIPLNAFTSEYEAGGYTISGLEPGKAGITVHLLEPGDYDLRVTAPGFSPGQATVSIRPGETADAQIVLDPL